MAHESFEDNEIARIMNDNFINIKVDREERPDLDDIYQRLPNRIWNGRLASVGFDTRSKTILCWDILP